MKITVLITSEALEEHTSLVGETNKRCGAFVEFRGVVRPMENEQPISALFYEAYQPMAETQMERILSELAAELPCEEVCVLHRVGVVAAGEAAIVVQVASLHRQEAFELVSQFMDRLKQDVPIWKARSIL